jgi:hypothetical protein
MGFPLPPDIRQATLKDVPATRGPAVKQWPLFDLEHADPRVIFLPLAIKFSADNVTRPFPLLLWRSEFRRIIHSAGGVSYGCEILTCS